MAHRFGESLAFSGRVCTGANVSSPLAQILDAAKRIGCDRDISGGWAAGDGVGDMVRISSSPPPHAPRPNILKSQAQHPTLHSRFGFLLIASRFV